MNRPSRWTSHCRSWKPPSGISPTSSTPGARVGRSGTAGVAVGLSCWPPWAAVSEDALLPEGRSLEGRPAPSPLVELTVVGPRKLLLLNIAVEVTGPDHVRADLGRDVDIPEGDRDLVVVE